MPTSAAVRVPRCAHTKHNGHHTVHSTSTSCRKKRVLVDHCKSLPVIHAAVGHSRLTKQASLRQHACAPSLRRHHQPHHASKLPVLIYITILQLTTCRRKDPCPCSLKLKQAARLQPGTIHQNTRGRATPVHICLCTAANAVQVVREETTPLVKTRYTTALVHEEHPKHCLRYLQHQTHTMLGGCRHMTQLKAKTHACDGLRGHRYMLGTASTTPPPPPTC